MIEKEIAQLVYLIPFNTAWADRIRATAIECTHPARKQQLLCYIEDIQQVIDRDTARLAMLREGL